MNKGVYSPKKIELFTELWTKNKLSLYSEYWGVLTAFKIIPIGVITPRNQGAIIRLK